MRCGFGQLAERVKTVIGVDPPSGHLFVFRSRRGDQPKTLVWDRHGYVLWYKRLERLTVWLMDQDITLRFSGYRHPQTQGKVERFHRSLVAALLRRGTPADSERQSWLNEFREEYNCLRPHEALQMRTPHQVWHKSERSFRESCPRWEYPAGSEVREVDHTGQFHLHRHRYYVSKALSGREVGVVEVQHRWLVYYRRTLICELDPLSPHATTAVRPEWSAGRV